MFAITGCLSLQFPAAVVVLPDTRACLCVSTRVLVCIDACACVCLAHTRACVYVRACVCVCTCVCVCMYVCARVCVRSSLVKSTLAELESDADLLALLE